MIDPCMLPVRFLAYAPRKTSQTSNERWLKKRHSCQMFGGLLRLPCPYLVRSHHSTMPSNVSCACGCSVRCAKILYTVCGLPVVVHQDSPIVLLPRQMSGATTVPWT